MLTGNSSDNCVRRGLCLPSPRQQASSSPDLKHTRLPVCCPLSIPLVPSGLLHGTTGLPYTESSLFELALSLLKRRAFWKHKRHLFEDTGASPRRTAGLCVLNLKLKSLTSSITSNNQFEGGTATLSRRDFLTSSKWVKFSLSRWHQNANGSCLRFELKHLALVPSGRTGQGGTSPKPSHATYGQC